MRLHKQISKRSDSLFSYVKLIRNHWHAQPPVRNIRLSGAAPQPTSNCRQSLQQSLFFGPITGLAIATVNPDETANAAGMSNFLRTLAGDRKSTRLNSSH